ncbi:MAG TPA: helix-turn-helix domain-containing protein, partial [Pyrinomonadaceae bacterium]
LDNLAKYRHLPKRWYCGEENSQSKLKNEDVLKIRELYDAGNISQKDLAKIFGVSTGVMWRIVHRKGWKSI